MKEYVIYKLIFPNGKIYIEQINDFSRRMNQYKNCYSKGNKSVGILVKNAICKYVCCNIKKQIIYETDASNIEIFFNI